VTGTPLAREFSVLVGPDDLDGTLVVTVTDEGVVADLFVGDEPVATRAWTAQELADDA
jgi:hypothetical protein